jgi:xanthine/uracil permease
MAWDRLRRLLPGLWAGWLLCVALLATPAPFALLAPHDAGRVAGRMLAEDAYASLALGVVLLVLERRAARRGSAAQFSLGMGLALGSLFCTVAGYFALQPMMEAARAGQGALSFGQLHAVSAVFYLAKIALVLALAGRAVRSMASS